MSTPGNKISQLRRQFRMTQEELAEKLDVSPQAVSKWENDLSMPDTQTLIRISDLFDVSLDRLLRPDRQFSDCIPETSATTPVRDMTVRITATGENGETAKISLPLSAVKLFIRSGIRIAKNRPEFQNIDFSEILSLAESGITGKILEVKGENGETVEICVE